VTNASPSFSLKENGSSQTDNEIFLFIPNKTTSTRLLMEVKEFESRHKVN